jgi:two-component system, OmpR family, sensor histidine kinase MprB
MTLRARLALLVAIAVAVAVALVSAGAYVATRTQLQREIDEGLVVKALELRTSVATRPDRIGEDLGMPPFIAEAVQVVGPNGEAVHPRDQRALPVAAEDVAVARGERDPVLRSVDVGGVHARMVTVPQGPGTALQVARPLTDIDEALRRLALILALVTVGGVVAAASAGLAIARAGLAPVDRLTTAAEHVARTQDLSVPIEVRGDDEVARLGRSFNAMLGALDRSRSRQRQLVADAGHELRTPLTSLRTNIELLARADASPERTLPPADRAKLLADLTAQTEELSQLVGELVLLARDEEVEEDREDVDLAEVVTRAVERAKLRAPGLRFDVELWPASIKGHAQLLERAVTNLLDNAVKWSPPDGRVGVRLRDGEITVTDEGPGIADEDLPHVFERFYRARTARGLPGSGLGLAIVRQAAEAHGGTVTATRGDRGGTVVRLRVPSA